ncbi:DNA repair protein RecO [Bacillus canaveralius]|uniref:DNA repair protein RecO n=1 Tax=Bacillus canaveralius TaxID=1403243 RepID=A0A2N5GR56_9BACI|nr:MULTISPECIES: DNA repair protein RecO [Bacillus]PLR85909.1 DNA repair protein RecO [Bacillus canaveralius]PLR87629.1 DNA repair protein RecO [Bacillus sp. V33-4]PLS00028.1 DNA repair protein RecO [Bacillus canaveralius]RSK56236.1 DNA repair protein RecO [Bacillus canaveralius]
MLQKCEGIVIRATDYGETNKIVTLYTREWGKVGVMARGAKKTNSRLSAVTQLFTYGYFLIHKGSGLGNLQQGELVSSMRSIREDIFLTAYASYIVDLTDKSTEEKKPNPYLFELLYQTLQYMNEGYDLEILTNIYQIKMLSVLGLYPVLNRCSVCGSTDGHFSFSIKEGGLICHRCEHHDPYRYQIAPATVKLLRLFQALDLSRLGNISVKQETKNELKKVISAYYEEYSGLHLKAKKFLDQIDKMRDMLS